MEALTHAESRLLEEHRSSNEIVGGETCSALDVGGEGIVSSKSRELYGKIGPVMLE